VHAQHFRLERTISLPPNYLTHCALSAPVQELRSSLESWNG
jgi:hypothetical protein